MHKVAINERSAGKIAQASVPRANVPHQPRKVFHQCWTELFAL